MRLTQVVPVESYTVQSYTQNHFMGNLIISQCGKMCGNELNLVNSFSVTLEWVEPAVSTK